MRLAAQILLALIWWSGATLFNDDAKPVLEIDNIEDISTKS